LGGNMSSRLFQSIREKHGLAYSIYSFLTAYADTGMVGVYSAVSPRDTNRCIALIMEEIRRLKNERVDPAALSDAKEFTKGNLLMAEESPDNQMMRLAQNEFYFGGYVPMQTVIDRIEAVSPEDLLHLANDLWADGRPALTALGPEADGVEPSEALVF
jgi:predicted Zn-dependent peptidase